VTVIAKKEQIYWHELLFNVGYRHALQTAGDCLLQVSRDIFRSMGLRGWGNFLI
jgi:hypothetical protein